MPQGSFFGPYVFLILINGLSADVPLIKFVDDITAVEIVDKGACSQMQSIVNQVAQWCQPNHMSINEKKTKEMLIGTWQSAKPPPLTLKASNIDRVSSFKLLGVHISDNLSWNTHVDFICSKASKRLHMLNLLRRSAVPYQELVHF